MKKLITISLFLIGLVSMPVMAGGNHSHSHDNDGHGHDDKSQGHNGSGHGHDNDKGGHSHGDSGHDDGHGHAHGPVSQDQAEKAAFSQIKRLVKKGKIDASWNQAKLAKAEKRKFGKKLEWVISFNNDKIKDSGKKTLYVFLSLSGEYVAANYSGK
ncbi:MAG: DUF6488 family protein [Gammaproteobacteria bacterium]|nr:DUF6488 family protein [Gammaproteobacteria bacterium]MDH5803150.1 DUF6488 family protein [Gammaproteobacteria bacterium]